MPNNTPLAVKDLQIDLANYRTVHTGSEAEAVHALIALRPHYFWDLTRSLIENGYEGTENIIILKKGKRPDLIVREGNRRVGALKLIHGILPLGKFDVPDDVEVSIKAIPAAWKSNNAAVPCSVYDESDADAVKRLVARTHARGETAGRLNWESVARARYNRDENGGNEPGLELLEKYLSTARKLTDEERERWGGDYPLTVLDEALQKVASRLKLPTATDVVTECAKNSALQRTMGRIIHDIGTEVLKTRELRLTSWGSAYNLPPAPSAAAATPSVATITAGGSITGTVPPPPATPPPSAGNSGPSNRVLKTLPLNDPKSVRRELKKFAPTGKSSSKVVDLLTEARRLDVEETPICFCFLLRSMFEVSVRDYCMVHKIPLTEIKNGKARDKSLADLLVDAGKHMSTAVNDPHLTGRIKTASTEIKSPHSLLSVPGMNALVHSPTATITPAQIVTGFHKILPLLIALNK